MLLLKSTDLRHISAGFKLILVLGCAEHFEFRGGFSGFFHPVLTSSMKSMRCASFRPIIWEIYHRSMKKSIHIYVVLPLTAVLIRIFYDTFMEMKSSKWHIA